MDNEKRPLVSVVLPTYNRIGTLPTAIYSVLNQTYDNLELIVMDDGSEDGTKEYLKNISDERLRYKRSDVNLGPSAARNMGARLARGEYLAFQDSDDEWMPDKLDKQMKLMLESGEFSLVYCAFAKYRNGELLGYTPSKTLPYEEKYGEMFARLLLTPLISTQTIVVKRKLFLEENGFDETLKSYEDYEFSLRFANKYRIGFVDEALVRVNSSPDGVNKRFAERIRTQFFMVREMLEAIRNLGLLWQKLEGVLAEAESLLCHDIFIE
ncbi:MAG: glycosyltransferase, partial [Acetatifactor sp.]|nr:glycosyltransferase [Acetatifactor sp.]